MFPSANAFSFTNLSITQNELNILKNEISIVERRIHKAAREGKFEVVHYPMDIGLPPADIMNDSLLTNVQKAFRDVLLNAGYGVERDVDTGYWRISWSDYDYRMERIVIYSVRTTVVPGPVYLQTEQAIVQALESLPVFTRARAHFNSTPPGGDIDETAFGAVPSVFYEYTVIAIQQDTAADLSSDIRTALLTSGLGYANGNVEVYRMT